MTVNAPSAYPAFEADTLSPVGDAFGELSPPGQRCRQIRMTDHRRKCGHPVTLLDEIPLESLHDCARSPSAFSYSPAKKWR
jgi:hypothetical protein